MSEVIAGFTVKTFAIVGFIEEDDVIEVIPSIWILNASETKWPTISSPLVLAKYIKQCKPLDKNWKALKIKIYGFSNTFKSAKYKAELAEETSNLESDSLDDSLLLKQRRRKRPARYQTTDTSASEDESNLKLEDCVIPKFREKSDSILNDSLLSKQRRRKKPARYQSTDISASENEPVSKKENCVGPKLREKSESSFNDNLLSKQRRRKRPARYKTSDSSASENESSLKKNNCVMPKLRKKSDSSLDDSLLSRQRIRKRPARYQNNDDFSFANESLPKLTKCNNSLAKEIEQKKPISIESIEKALNKRESTTPKKKQMFSESTSSSFNILQHSKKSITLIEGRNNNRFSSERESTKEKKNHIFSETNKASSEPVTLQKPQNTFNEGDSVKMFSQILQYVKQIHGELKELNSKYENISWQLTRLSKSAKDPSVINICLPADIDLPVTSEDMLVKLNNKLKTDKEFSTALVHYFLAYGNGKEVRLFLLSLAKKILSPELAACYCICPRKGKKSFLKHTEILNVILTATTLQFKDFIRQDLFEMLDKHLAEARDWSGKR